MEAEASAVERLQEHLLRLIDDVRRRGREDPVLRADVLIQMNLLCSRDLLLGLWQLLEEVDLREEMLLVRMLVDLDPEGVEEQALLLLQSESDEVRSTGYGILALHSTRSGIAHLVEAFHREPALVLKRGGHPKLAPYSFTTGMLAGIREFKDGELDRRAMQALRRYSQGAEDIDLLLELIADPRARVAKLGFVALASRFMGWIHRSAYEQTICEQPPPLYDGSTREWLMKAIEAAPEIIEVLIERGPAGLSGPRFARARVAALREVGDASLAGLCSRLLRGDMTLPSARIESELYVRAALASSQTQQRTRELGYLIALLMEYRPALADLIEGLIKLEEVELMAVERLLLLSTSRGAFNLATSMIAHWYQLDPDDEDEGPLWRWIDGLWRDDRHLTPMLAMDAALNTPDETAVYAAQILAGVDDPFGRALRDVCSGEPVSDAALIAQINDPRWVAALRAHLRHSKAQMHPQTIIAIARLGLPHLTPIFLNRRANYQEESPERGALDYALRLMEATQIALNSPALAGIEGLGLRALDRQFERLPRARQRLESLLGASHPFPQLLANSPASGVLRIMFWACESDGHLLEDTSARPFDLSVEMAIDLERRKSLQSVWIEGRDQVHASPPSRRPTPERLTRGFLGVPWRVRQHVVSDVLESLGGALIVLVPREGRRARCRVLARVHHQEVWLDFDHDGHFFCGSRKVPATDAADGIRELHKRYGEPSFGSAFHARWCFETVEVTLRPEPSMGWWVEEVVCREA